MWTICYGSQSDPNSIEHLLEILDWCIRQWFPPTSSKHQMRHYHSEEWYSIFLIDFKTLENLSLSKMPRNTEAVLVAMIFDRFLTDPVFSGGVLLAHYVQLLLIFIAFRWRGTLRHHSFSVLRPWIVLPLLWQGGFFHSIIKIIWVMWADFTIDFPHFFCFDFWLCCRDHNLNCI